MSSRPVILDLFCGAGGAAMGYYRAGFDVVGVDIKPQPRYPFEFIQGDALEYLATADLSRYSAIHASPPCQGYSLGVRREKAKATPQLIEPTRTLLLAIAKPYVIENVRGARRHLRAIPEGYFVLCGTMFSEDVPVRHRLFEARPFIWSPPHRKCLGHNKRLASRLGVNRRMVEVATVHENVPLWRELMGIDWCDDAFGLSEAIPPAYTEFIGRHLMAHITDGQTLEQ